MCRDDWLRDGRNVIQQPTYAGKQQKRTQPNQSERKNQTKGRTKLWRENPVRENYVPCRFSRQ